MQDEELTKFHLAGGTALALYLGHRRSIDLDLFTPFPFDSETMEKYLAEKYHFESDFRRNNTLKGTINTVKIDCITYAYPLVEAVCVSENIRLYAMKDIAAMKLSAIAGDGSRLKDFIDIACLSVKLSLSDMLEAYQKKFGQCNAISPVKGMVYFDDITLTEPVVMMKGNYNWKKIQRRLYDMIKEENTVFQSFPV
jgi:predicted secreted acid phosphatase